MVTQLYYIPMLIGIILVAIGTFRPVFQDWDKKVLTPFNVGCVIIGFIILIITCISLTDSAEKENKQTINYFNNLKSEIKNMDCKSLGNYIINNSDNNTLSDNEIISLAHGIYGVKCHE